jgi:hypothetical protein
MPPAGAPKRIALHVTGIKFLHHGIAFHHNPPLCLPRFSGNCVMTQKQR